MLNTSRRLKTVTLIFIIVFVLYHGFFAKKIPSNAEVSSKRIKDDAHPVYYYKDLEAHLCHNKTVGWQENHVKGSCPKKGIISIIGSQARTGNQMWDYASVLGIARRTGLEPYVPRCLKSNLNQLFEQLSLPTFEEIAHCPVEFKTFASSIEEWTLTNQSIILPRYTLQPELVLTWVQDIVQDFRFRKKLRDNAQQILSSIVKELPPREYTFIGVHVRRTDYIGFLYKKYGVTPVRPQFFINAMNHYKAKYPDCLFVYLSDDPTWCYNQFGQGKDVFVVSYKKKNPPAVDMAIMAACNHSIFDYGTFGEWGAILAGGETVYNNMTQNIRKNTKGALKNWILMD